MAKDLEFIQRGKVLIVRRQFQEAVRVCRLGLLANPTLVEGRLVLGMALMALGRYDDVLAEMRVALEVDPNNTLATLLKGEALFYKGDHEQAQEVLERARKLDPKNDKPEKLLREIRLAREAGLAPDVHREVTDTKVYPAVADGPPAAKGPLDLPEALPPPKKNGSDTAPLPRKDAETSSIVLQSKDLEYSDEQTEVDASPAGSMAAEPTALAEAAQAKIVPGRPPMIHAKTEVDGPPAAGEEEEERTTMPWVGSDDDEESTADGKLPAGEPTPVRPAPMIPPQARPTPKPTLLGLGVPLPTPPVVDVPARPSRRNGDGFEDTGQGDDYADSSAPSLPHLPGQSDSSSVSVSSTATTNSMQQGPSQSITLDETTEPTRPESPGSIAINPGRPTGNRPPPLPVASPFKPLPQTDSDESFDLDDARTEPRPPEDGVGSHTVPLEPSIVPRPPQSTQGRPPSAPVPRPMSGPVSTGKVSGNAPAMASRRRSTFLITNRLSGRQWRMVAIAAAGVLVLSIGLGLGIRVWRGRAEASRRRDQAAHQIATGNLPGYLWAERAYDQVLAAYPEDPEALAGRALVRAATLYEFDEADRDAKGAIEAARKWQTPKSAPMIDAANVYVQLADGDAETAEKTAREAATRFEDDALLAYLVGRAQMVRGDARAASDSFRTALKRDPHSVLALYGLGLSLAGVGEARDALAAYDRALEENGNHIATLIARARLRVGRGRDLFEAETDLVAVAEKFRDKASRAQVAWAELALAALYAQKGDVQRARTALDEARRSGPERNPGFWEEAAHDALKVYDVAGAKKDAQRAISLMPTTPGPHLALAEALLEEGSAEAALKELVATQARDTPDVLVLRARARLALGRIEPARQDLDVAESKAPDVPEVTLTRARVDLADHNAARAVASLRKLAERLPGRADVAEVLGMALAQRGDPGAKPALERAVALNGQAWGARVELAHLLRKEGKVSDAAARMEEAVKIHADPAADRELAELLYDAGDLVGAQKAIDAVVAATAQPDGPFLLLAARVAAASGEPDAANRLATQAVAKGASPLRANKVRADAMLNAGKPKDAVNPARQAVLANSDDPDARALYILALGESGRAERARLFLRDSYKRLGYRAELLMASATLGVKEDRPNVKLLERAVRAVKNARKPPRVLSDAYQLLGSAYYNQGEVGHAGAVFDQALMLNRHNARANYFQGLMLSESGQTEEARKAFQAATESRPYVPPAFFELGKLLQKDGDRAGAKRAYEEYLKLDPDGDYAEDARKEIATLGRSG